MQQGRSHGMAGAALSLEESQHFISKHGTSIDIRWVHSERTSPARWNSDRHHHEQKQRQGTKGLSSLSEISMLDGRSIMQRSHLMGFKTSSRVMWADLQVKVPPLGESITDGSVAAVLKQEGDTVEEDDPLIQIETDKVTVDVRSPVAGVVKSILVQADETVHVDSVVAVVKEGEAAGKAEGHVPVADTAKKDTVSSASPAAASSSPSADAGEGAKTSAISHSRPVSAAPGAYIPSISFPTRRTADGRIISELSAEEQMIIRNDELAAKHSVHFFMAKRQVERPPLPPRRELSDKEMETVMLGGAE